MSHVSLFGNGRQKLIKMLHWPLTIIMYLWSRVTWRFFPGLWLVRYNNPQILLVSSAYLWLTPWHSNIIIRLTRLTLFFYYFICSFINQVQLAWLFHLRVSQAPVNLRINHPLPTLHLHRHHHLAPAPVQDPDLRHHLHPVVGRTHLSIFSNNII